MQIWCTCILPHQLTQTGRQQNNSAWKQHCVVVVGSFFKLAPLTTPKTVTQMLTFFLHALGVVSSNNLTTPLSFHAWIEFHTAYHLVAVLLSLCCPTALWEHKIFIYLTYFFQNDLQYSHSLWCMVYMLHVSYHWQSNYIS